MRDFTLIALAGASLVFSLPQIASAQDESRPIWEQEAMLIYSDSSTEFTRLRTIGLTNKRLGLYTRALDILHGKQPPEEGKLPYEVALELFRILVAENDQDAIGLASLYYQARIAQSNPVEQDLETAKQLYFDLFEPNKDRFFGQMAFLKYATLEIYDYDEGEEDALIRIQNLEPMADVLTLPEMRRNFHRVIGEAYVHFDLSPKRAFDHLVTAYDLGLPVESIRMDALRHIARIGEEIGEVERALSAYDEMLMLEPHTDEAEAYRARARALRRKLDNKG